MSQAVSPIIRLVRTPAGRLVQWHLYRDDRSGGRLEYRAADGSPTALAPWRERMSILVAATPCEGGAFVTGWIPADISSRHLASRDDLAQVAS